MKNRHPFSYINLVLINLLVLFSAVIHCDKKPLYHQFSKQVFQAGNLLPEALFGYSIAYQKGRQTIVIGAPRADFQGQVFECDTTSNHTCSKVDIEIDPKPMKDAQFWLGAAVSAGSDFFMTCAPRYSTNKGNGEKSRTWSRCYYQGVTGVVNKNPIQLTDKEKSNSNEYFYSKSPPLGLEKKFDTMGWSMDVSSDDVTIVGGPGAAMGRVMLVPRKKINRPQLIHLRRKNSDPDALVLYDFGYSVKAGKFLGKEVYAISTPYGAMGKGKVLFYSKELEYIHAIVDDEVGVIFGGTLCGARLGAGDEALLVGAPAYALGARDELDVGAVFVYLNEKGKMIRKRTIRGYKNKGYFGYAIATVGDINLDGKDEVVISAPYENEYRGAVYIFSGADLVKDATAHIEWMQRVEGEAPFQMLGLALSAVQDLDGNGCNELSIGLPGGNSALLLKCMTFINFTLSLEENSNHEVNNTLFIMDMCVNFTFNEKLKEIENNYVSTVVKIDHPNATLVNSVNDTLTLLHKVSLGESCPTIQINLPLNGNYEKAIVLQVNASLSDQNPRKSTEFKHGLVILSDEAQTYLERELFLNLTYLNMNLSTSFSDNTDYIIGSTKRENITIVVWNAAESRGGAYDASLQVKICASAHCHLPWADDEALIYKYKFSEPIFAGKTMTRTITLDTASLTAEVNDIEITAGLFQHIDDEVLLTKNMTKIHLQKDVNITVAGESNPPVVNITENQIAFGYEDITHVYSIINTGVTNLGATTCTIRIPQYEYGNVSIDSLGGKCTQDKAIATCALNILGNNTKNRIIISMEMLPNSSFTEKLHSKKLLQFETELTCMIVGEKRIERITTTLNLLHTSVPTWILVVAIVIGLIALLIMTFVLYECGFLRRKHKEELTALIKDVRRQSIRRSMRLRESKSEEYNDQLELNNEADDTESVVTIDVTETEERQKQPESGSMSVVADIH